MTSFCKKMLLILLVFLSNWAFAQEGEITIRFIGNCALYLNDGDTDIYIDFPYKSGAHNYMEYDQTEIENIKGDAIFIFTHRHADHFSKKILKKLSGQKYGPWNMEELDKLGQIILDFEIKAFKTRHKVFGISFKHFSYLITWHNKKIYISGDTENADTIAAQNGIDWAFVPVWLFMDAKEKGIKLRDQIKMFAVYHIGPNDRIINDGTDPQIKLLDKQGEIIKIPF